MPYKSSSRRPRMVLDQLPRTCTKDIELPNPVSPYVSQSLRRKRTYQSVRSPATAFTTILYLLSRAVAIPHTIENAKNLRCYYVHVNDAYEVEKLDRVITQLASYNRKKSRAIEVFYEKLDYPKSEIAGFIAEGSNLRTLDKSEKGVQSPYQVAGLLGLDGCCVSNLELC